MKLRILYLSLLSVVVSSCSIEDKQPNQRPNIILILADDLGYGELGAYGQELIETPNIDALARSGMKFTSFYSSAPVCAPARYMLLSGKHAGHSYIRGNDEWNERGPVWDYKEMIKDSTLEGQRPIPSNTPMLSKKLQELGYTTALIGKWGLGAPHTNAIPNKMGFDYFYGYNCQRQAHTYYPVHLYENEHRVYLKNDTVAPHTKLSKGLDPYQEDSYGLFNQQDYAPTLMYEKMEAFIEQSKDEPFFLYWASPIPHNPLQAPKKWVDYYTDKFGDEEPYVGEKGYFPSKSPRATYAAMISYLDENVGKLVKKLKENGTYDHTIIMFTSDNGVTYSGGTDGTFFNSSGVFGEKYGRGKGFVYEGGIRVPMIVSWPNRIKEGATSAHVAAQYDILQTLADLTGYTLEGPQDGISFLPTLLGENHQNLHDFLYWEFPEYGGQIAIRMGAYKLIRKHLKNKQEPTLELYHLPTDPEELHNVAMQHPEIIQKAEAIFNREHSTPELDRFKIPLLEKGLLAEE